MIIAAKLHQYTIALTAPLKLAQQWHTHRQGLIIELTFSDGSKGFGEAAPLPGFSAESIDVCKSELIAKLRQLIHQKKTNSPSHIDKKSTLPPAAAFALDCALNKIPYRLLAGEHKTNTHMPTTLLLQGSKQSIIKKLNDRHRGAPNPLQVKLKVARQPLEQDAMLICDLLDRWPELTFQLDANQGWSLEQALDFSVLIPKEAINTIEEPCYDLRSCLTFAKQTNINIALDESLRSFNEITQSTTASPATIIEQIELVLKNNPLINMLVVKPTLLGHFGHCSALIALARTHQIKSYLSSSFESSLALMQYQTLAATAWHTINELGLDTLDAMTASLKVNQHQQLYLENTGQTKKISDQPAIDKNAVECLWKS